MKLKANLILVNVPTDDPEQTQRFYSEFLGIDLVRSLYEEKVSYHAPISNDGIDLTINERFSPQETPMVLFAVDDLDSTLDDLRGLGGDVVWGPSDMPIAPSAREDYKRVVKEEWPELRASDDLGRAAIVRDPGGGQFGVVELEEHAHGHFAHGRFRKELDDKQVRVHRKAAEVSKKVKKK